MSFIVKYLDVKLAFKQVRCHAGVEEGYDRAPLQVVATISSVVGVVGQGLAEEALVLLLGRLAVAVEESLTEVREDDLPVMVHRQEEHPHR